MTEISVFKFLCKNLTILIIKLELLRFSLQLKMLGRTNLTKAHRDFCGPRFVRNHLRRHHDHHLWRNSTR